jgi:hypothetical protein
MKQYKYHLRPGYGSKQLLLQFFPDIADTVFEKDLFSALQEIHPSVQDVQYLWMNDEVVLTVCCDKGEFQYSKDVWGFAFIMAEENQDCVLAIDELLKLDNLFFKEDVDFEQYKMFGE